MSLLDISQLSHTYGDNVLFKNAEFSLNKGEHIGIVGQNGTGKSTFIKICTGQVIPDSGSVSWQPRLAVGYLDQYAESGKDQAVQAFLKSAFDGLYETQKEMTAFYDAAAKGDMEALDFAARCQSDLEAKDFYHIDTRIQQVSTGLGLAAIGLDRPMGELSGGQRAKAILAKLLLQQPDVLLLDEPTNFLDKDHIAWLGEYLSALENAFMIVSHDHAFLEKVANRICDIDNKSIKKYYGSYSEFLKKKALMREDYIRQYSAQQREIKKTEEFIRKNIAGRKTRMAQGRRKQLERLDRLEALDQTEIKPSLRFQSLPVSKGSEYLAVRQFSVGYDYPILTGLNFTVTAGQKVVITGFNGIGKSTLLKTLIGELPPAGGSFTFAEQVTAGYFQQDLKWEDEALTPIQVISAAYTGLTNKEARQRLARCGISSKHAMQEVGTLSGGEQAKVKLCLLTGTPCNFLILDEPTNHLDLQAKEALKAALTEFAGTVLLVSHEEAFYRGWADRVISIEI